MVVLHDRSETNRPSPLSRGGKRHSSRRFPNNHHWLAKIHAEGGPTVETMTSTTNTKIAEHIRITVGSDQSTGVHLQAWRIIRTFRKNSTWKPLCSNVSKLYPKRVKINQNNDGQAPDQPKQWNQIVFKEEPSTSR